MIETDELREVAHRATLAGVEVASAWSRRREEPEAEEKAAAPDDLVSAADRETERAIRAVLSEVRPGGGVLGEEDGATPARAVSAG